MVEGVFAIYKEEGMTSHDVVDAVRRLTGQQRVGHAGTLDPCAKGVLVVGVGRAATRQLRAIAGTEKEYITRVKLGWRSTTEDREGKVEQVFWPTADGRGRPPCLPYEGQPRGGAATGVIPTEKQVRQALAHFQGMIDQQPPAFSAIKVRGRAAYKLARKGCEVDLPARKVEVKEIELLAYAWPHVDVRLVTGPGFYVRSFARDLGELLGTGGYMEALERIRVGAYTKEHAARLADLAKSIGAAGDNEPTS
ncbi:MAG: tRNA pseudouridine(55) synthase TruB [Planctomycetes bacterium]|nr:tRNA pseudouridine(55) synthase TruB [Planctomycetota bacterium]